MVPISLCIITKNESQKLDKCLTCASRYPFEIVVVDTGSTDDTIETAKKYTDNIFFFEWISDFSAARNFSISKASHDWILVLDTDEYIEDIDLDTIYELIEQHPYGLGCLMRYSPNNKGSIMHENVPRLFNRNIYHYVRPVHEQVYPYDGHPMQLFAIPLSCRHDGYVGTSKELEEKSKRDLQILIDNLETYKDGYSYYQIAQSYYMMGDSIHAMKYYEKAFDYDLNPGADYTKLMVINYGYCLKEFGRVDEALQLYEQLSPYFDYIADFVYLYGLLYMEKKEYLKAAVHLIKASTLTTFFIEGTNTYLPCYFVGTIYHSLGSDDVARMYLEKCGDYQPAKEKLKELFDI